MSQDSHCSENLRAGKKKWITYLNVCKLRANSFFKKQYLVRKTGQYTILTQSRLLFLDSRLYFKTKNKLALTTNSEQACTGLFGSRSYPNAARCLRHKLPLHYLCLNLHIINTYEPLMVSSAFSSRLWTLCQQMKACHSTWDMIGIWMFINLPPEFNTVHEKHWNFVLKERKKNIFQQVMHKQSLC